MAQQAVVKAKRQVLCWCCGAHRSLEVVGHLGDHPEFALRLR